MKACAGDYRLRENELVTYALNKWGRQTVQEGERVRERRIKEEE